MTGFLTSSGFRTILGAFRNLCPPIAIPRRRRMPVLFSDSRAVMLVTMNARTGASDSVMILFSPNILAILAGLFV
jgi:hypothetical protein